MENFEGGVEVILQSPKTTKAAKSCLLVPRAGVEPARMFSPRDFKSLVSTNFTTWASRFSIAADSLRVLIIRIFWYCARLFCAIFGNVLF